MTRARGRPRTTRGQRPARGHDRWQTRAVRATVVEAALPPVPRKGRARPPAAHDRSHTGSFPRDDWSCDACGSRRTSREAPSPRASRLYPPAGHGMSRTGVQPNRSSARAAGAKSAATPALGEWAARRRPSHRFRCDRCGTGTRQAACSRDRPLPRRRGTPLRSETVCRAGDGQTRCRCAGVGRSPEARSVSQAATRWFVLSSRICAPAALRLRLLTRVTPHGPFESYRHAPLTPVRGPCVV